VSRDDWHDQLSALVDASIGAAPILLKNISAAENNAVWLVLRAQRRIFACSPAARGTRRRRRSG